MLNCVFGSIALGSTTASMVGVELKKVMRTTENVCTINRRCDITCFTPSCLSDRVRRCLGRVKYARIVGLKGIAGSPGAILVRRIRRINSRNCGFLLSRGMRMICSSLRLTGLSGFRGVLLFTNGFSVSGMVERGARTRCCLSMAGSMRYLTSLKKDRFEALFLSASSALFGGSCSSVSSLMGSYRGVYRRFMLGRGENNDETCSCTIGGVMSAPSVAIPIMRSMKIKSIFSAVIAVCSRHSSFRRGLLGTSCITTRCTRAAFVSRFEAVTRRCLDLPVRSGRGRSKILLP